MAASTWHHEISVEDNFYQLNEIGPFTIRTNPNYPKYYQIWVTNDDMADAAKIAASAKEAGVVIDNSFYSNAMFHYYIRQAGGLSSDMATATKKYEQWLESIYA